MTSVEPGTAGFAIKVSGVAVDPAVLGATIEIVVDNRCRLPDRLLLRVRDDSCSILDQGTFAVGASVLVSLAASIDDAAAVVFDGQVTTIAPEFLGGVTQLGVLALDRGCRLQRGPSTATFQEMSYGSIASQLASAAGLEPGSVEDGLTLPYVQQSNETDWDFLWRLAADVDYEVKVEGRNLHFRPFGTGGASAAVKLELGRQLVDFRPRITGVGQVDTVTVRGWDPVGTQTIVTTVSPRAAQSRPGISRDSVVSVLGSGRAVIVDHPVLDADHADVVARGLASRIGNAFVEGEGTALGNPLLTAGGTVNITGVGHAFSGIYALSGVRHVVRATTGYATHFFITGREDRSLLGLASAGPRQAGDWPRRLVVGIVTNNQDPDQLGRVRVRYPALDDSHEGWWARVVIPGAGAARGNVTLPLVGDEVLVAFEHGSDQHPYVLGSVFNGQGKPGELAADDGSFAWTSVAKMTFVAAQATAISTKDALTLSSVGKATLTTAGEGSSGGDIEVASSGGLVLSAQTDAKLSTPGGVTVDTQATLKLSGATTVDVDSSGQVTIHGTTVQIKADAVVQISAPQVLLG